MAWNSPIRGASIRSESHRRFPRAPCLLLLVRSSFVVLLAISTAFCIDVVWRHGNLLQRIMSVVLVLSGLALVVIRC